ncbi:MAG: NERD domain-containing protein [Chloroflexi bacterium]|nr:NERD domain-containing protein [Chloroflexota bacterium]
MKIITNERLISRNAKIGVWGQILGLAMLAGSLVVTFQSAEYFGLSLLLLAFGFLLSQIGIYFSNRWSRRPRPDEHLDKALKGMDKSYTLYHYRTPVSHLLVGPAGIWVINPRSIRGSITYLEDKSRWKHRGGSIFGKLFGQDGLGRPDLELRGEIKAFENFLEKNLGENKLPVQAALIFTFPEIVIDAKNSHHPTLPVRKLKDFIRKQAKQRHVPQDRILEITSLLPEN